MVYFKMSFKLIYPQPKKPQTQKMGNFQNIMMSKIDYVKMTFRLLTIISFAHKVINEKYDCNIFFLFIII